MNPVSLLICAIGASAPKFQTTAASTFRPVCSLRHDVDRLEPPVVEVAARGPRRDAGAVDEQLVALVRARMHDESVRHGRHIERLSKQIDADGGPGCRGVPYPRGLPSACQQCRVDGLRAEAFVRPGQDGKGNGGSKGTAQAQA